MVGSAQPSDKTAERRLPPTLELAVATLVLVIAGGTFVAAYLPQRAPFAFPLVLLVAAVVILDVNVILLSRVRDFAWDAFFRVAGWTLLAYIVIAGMLEWVFVADGTPGDALALLSGMLLVYAIDIPLLFGFAVARYQPPSRR